MPTTDDAAVVVINGKRLVVRTGSRNTVLTTALGFAPSDRLSTDCGLETHSTIGGGRACDKFVPVLGRDGTKIAPTGRGKLADPVEDHVVLSPEGSVLVTYPGTESSYPRPPQSLNNSLRGLDFQCGRQQHDTDRSGGQKT